MMWSAIVAVGEREYTCVVNEYGSAAFLSRDHLLTQYRRIFVREYRNTTMTRPVHVDPAIEIREMEIAVVANGNRVSSAMIEDMVRGLV